MMYFRAFSLWWTRAKSGVVSDGEGVVLDGEDSKVLVNGFALRYSSLYLQNTIMSLIIICYL